MKLFARLAALLAGVAGLMSPTAVAATWRAGVEPAPLPSQMDPPWRLENPDGLSPALVSDQGLILETGAGQRLFYARQGADVNLTDSFRLSASLLLPAGANPDPAAVPASLGFIRADGRRIALHLSPGRVSLTADADGTGPGPSVATDTSVLHTYRLTVDERTTPHMAVLTISGGGTLRTPLFEGAAAQGPRLFFGATRGTAGRAVWRSVSDNATGVAFSYQGRLNFPRATAANGRFDFEFELWDSPEGGTQLGTKRQLTNVEVRGGLFNVDLNFGGAVLTDTDPWLAISVRRAADTTEFTRLNPRVPIRPVPLALQLTEPPVGQAVTAFNGLRDEVFFEVGPGLNLETDTDTRVVSLTLNNPGAGPHDHFGQAWQGANPLAGLLLGNTDAAGAALRLDAAGDLLRGFPLGAQPGQPPSFRVSRLGDVSARAFAGNGSALTGLSWDQLPGTIPVERLPQIPRDKLPADLGGGGGAHNHFGESWSGSAPIAGLQIENTHGESVAVLGRAPGVVGTGVRGYGQRAGLEGGGIMTGVMAASSAGSSLYALTDTGINLELSSGGGDFIRGTKQFGDQTFRVSADGDVFARNLALSGNFTGLSWAALAGTIPVDKLPLIPRDKLPADLGGGGEHTHFGQAWSGNTVNGLKVTNTRSNSDAAGLFGQATVGTGVLGEGETAGVAGSNSNPAIQSYGTLGSLSAGVAGYHSDDPGVLGSSSVGPGVEGYSLGGPAVVATAPVGGGNLFVGKLGSGFGDVKFAVANDGTVAATRFQGDGSMLTSLSWNQFTGEVPEFKLPAAVARTGHNHAGETWSALGKVLELHGGLAPGVPTFTASATESTAIHGESMLGPGVTGRSFSSDQAAVRGEAAASGPGVVGVASAGAGIHGQSAVGAGVSARAGFGVALVLNSGGGALIAAHRDVPGGNTEVFGVSHEGSVSAAGSMSATAFNTTSDRHAKTGFTAVDPQEVLRKVSALPITRWAFTNAAAVAHIGPVAQDFHAAFGVGADDRHIATVDADGVALAAIQGLNTKLESELRTKDTELRALKAELAELRQLLRGAAQPQP